MTEQLSHSPHSTEHVPDTEELQALYDLEPNTETEQPTGAEQRDTREVSSAATRVRAAAERIGTILERRAIARAHSEALKEYRDRDHSDYVDHVSSLADNAETKEARDYNRALLRKDERRTDREELIDAGKARLRTVGNIAVEQSKEAGTIAYGLGVMGKEKAKSAAKDAGLTALGLGVMGYEAASKRYETAKFRHELNSESRAFRKDYKRETKRFDKDAERASKRLKKEAKQDIRVAKKEDRRFEREMRAKMRSEKWEARITKINVAYESKKEAVIVRLENGARRTGEAYYATKESYEAKKQAVADKKRRVGAFALKARSAGAAAWSAGRDELRK